MSNLILQLVGMLTFIVLCFWIGSRQDAATKAFLRARNIQRHKTALEPTDVDRELVRRVQHWYNDNVIDGRPQGEWHLECSPEHAARLVAQHRRDHP